ncbi:MAG: hypothetical protein ACYTHK_10820 [Planctomycetota bacterium]
MRFVPLLVLAACTHTALPLPSGELPPKNRVVLAGELDGADSLTLKGADGRNYRVVPDDGRFVVSVPAGVYDFCGRTVTGIPGDVLYVGSIRVDGGVAEVKDNWNSFDRTGLPAGSRSATAGVSLFSGTAHRRSAETPGRYQMRTGQPTRPLPGSGRAGQGIGLRGR